MQRREADGTGAEDQHPVAGPDGIAAALSLIQRSTNSMLAAIPFDAMATRAGLAHGGHWSTYAPPLGPMIEGANMRTIAEDQRRLVASHIVYLQHILAESVVSDDTPRP